MNFGSSSKPVKSLCCFPVLRKHRQKSTLDTSSMQSARDISSPVCAEVESSISSPKVFPHEGYHHEHLGENNLSNHNIQTYSTDGTVEIQSRVRDHSATLSSLDIVVKRNSINGSISDMDDDLDNDFEPDANPECLPQLRYASNVSRNTSEKYSSEGGQRISTVSYVSSGYGSLKDRFLTAEMISVPLETHVESGIGSTSSLAMDDSEKSSAGKTSREEMMKTETARLARQVKKNELLNIISRIEDSLEKRNLKPEDRTKILIQLPTFSAKYLTSKGGKITIPGTLVSLYVPPDALDETDEPVLIYIYLKQLTSGAQLGEGRRWLTPNVECGPPGLTFKKDVYLTMPHYAVNPSHWDFDGHQTKGQDRKESTPSILRDAIIVSKYEVTMLLDHFCSHGCSGKSSCGSVSQGIRTWMKAGVSFHRNDDQHWQMRVQLHDINVVTHTAIETESFPVNESASKVLVVAKGLNCQWELVEEPIKEIPAEGLWSNRQRDREVSFAVKMKCPDQVVEELSAISCTLDVFQHNNEHPGATLSLQERSLSRGTLEHKPNETEDIHIQFLLEQEDLAPTTYTGLSNQGFREICMQLEIADDCNKGWKALAEEIGFKEYQYIVCLEKRALARKRSPAGMVLDMFFKEADPGMETLKRLSNFFYKIDNYSAQMVVDREIQAMEDKMRVKVCPNNLPNGDTKVQTTNGYGNALSSTTSAISITDDNKLGVERPPNVRKRSLRTNLLRKTRSSIQQKVDKMSKLTRRFNSEKSGNQEHSGQFNPSFEDTEPIKSTPEVLKLPLPDTKFNECDIQENSHIPCISITSCEYDPETDGDQINSVILKEDVKDDAIMVENSLLGLHQQEALKLTASRPDSGISSLSSGSRDSSYSCKSVNGHGLTVSNCHEEEF